MTRERDNGGDLDPKYQDLLQQLSEVKPRDGKVSTKEKVDIVFYAEQFKDRFMSTTEDSKIKWYKWNNIRYRFIPNAEVEAEIYQELKDNDFAMNTLGAIFKAVSYECYSDTPPCGVYRRDREIVNNKLEDKVRICFPNCIVTIDCTNGDVGTEPHDRKWRFSRVIPYNYNADAKCPLFSDVLTFAMSYDYEDIYAFGCICATMFLPWQYWPLHTFLWGAEDTCKSTIVNALANMVGKENFTSVSFSALADDKGRSLTKLERKMLNAVTEVKHISVKETSVWKATLSDEYSGVDDKYQDLTDRRSPATFLSATNFFPTFDSVHSADIKRILVFHLINQLKGEQIDITIPERLKAPEEMEGVIAWVFSHMPAVFASRVRPHGGKKTRALYTQTMLKADPFAYCFKTCWKKANNKERTHRSIFWKAVHKFLKQHHYTLAEANSIIAKAQKDKRLWRDFGIKTHFSREEGKRYFTLPIVKVSKTP